MSEQSNNSKEWAIDAYDFVESCEPDCSKERHAYHQGQWDMAGRINKHFGLGNWPGAVSSVAASHPSTDTNTSFKKELEQILKDYHDRLLMTETAYDIKQRNTALTSIINLVDKEVIGEDYPYMTETPDSTTWDAIPAAKNTLKAEQRAIIRGNE